jgi:putative oxidoreductase
MNSRDLGLFVARGVVGGAVAAHGYQKLFGWFGGAGLDGTSEMFQKMGFEPARQAALASGLAEGVGGTMLAIGAATPVAAAAIAGNMTVASSVHRPNGFFASNGGFEYPATLGLLAAAIALTGPGNLSFDRILRHRYSKTWMGFAGLTAAIGVATSVIQRREQAARTRSAAEPPATADSATDPQSGTGQAASDPEAGSQAAA